MKKIKIMFVLMATMIAISIQAQTQALLVTYSQTDNVYEDENIKAELVRLSLKITNKTNKPLFVDRSSSFYYVNDDAICLDEKNDARYTFYGDEPLKRLDFLTPEICPDDVVVFGSYYALNPANREFVKKFLSYARSCGAIIYYDINFRPSHASDLDQLRPFIMDNIASSDIVRASVDDIHTAFGISDPRLVYDTVISPYCSVFICTDASREILLADYGSFYEYPVQKIETVSTIGAGDSFNAGIAYGLIHEDVVKDDLRDAPWEQLIEWGQLFSRSCCMSISRCA